MELFLKIEEAAGPILPGLIIAVIFIVLGFVLQLKLKGQPIVERFKRPATLFYVYIFLFCATIFSKLYWPTGYRVAYLISILILTLALVLSSSVAFFDLFIAKYRQISLPSILKDMLVIVIYGTLVVLILHQEGVAVTSLVTTSAVFTAIIGFALQDLLSNVISGLSIQIENPFKVGDWIKFNEYEGRVEEINWRATKIQTLDLEILVIPNNMATRSAIKNLSEPNEIHRRELAIGLRYEARPNLVHESLLKAVAAIDEVLKRPKPRVLTKEYADFSINYKLFYYIEDLPKREIIDSLVATRVWYQLNRDGLSIPFPIQDVNLHTVSTESEKNKQEQHIQKVSEILKYVPEFEPLSESEKQFLAGNTKTLYFAKGEEIITEGQVGSSFYILAEGDVKILISEGEEYCLLNILHPNDYFGERSIITGDPCTASAIAVDDCILYEISKQDLASVLIKNHLLVEALGKKLAERETETVDAKQELIAGQIDPGRPTEPASFVKKIRNFFQL